MKTVLRRSRRNLIIGKFTAMSVFLLLVGACTTGPQPVPQPVTTSPIAGNRTVVTTPRTTNAVRTPVIDPRLIDIEIDRRKEALRSAQDQLSLRPEPQDPKNRLLINSWSIAVERQVRELEQLAGENRNTALIINPMDKAAKAQDMASKLMEILSIAPIAPPIVVAQEAQTKDMSVPWNSVRQDYQNGDCHAVVASYDHLRTMMPDAEPPADVTIKVALCESRLGQNQAAISMIEDLFRGESYLLDLQYLKYLHANLLFQDGQLDKAEKAYQSLLDVAKEREQWNDLAKLRMSQIQLRRGEAIEGPAIVSEQAGPSTGESSAVPQTPAEGPSGESPETVQDQQAAATDQQVTEQDVTNSPSPTETDQPAQEEASATPFTDKPSAIAGEENRSDKLDEARRLIDNEQYDQAIAVYHQLLGTEFETKAQEGIIEAQDKYAEKQRRKAAALVLQARREADSETRKGLLINALETLQTANFKYPGNRFFDKIEDNIRQVTSQIQKIDPQYQPPVPGTSVKDKTAFQSDS